MRWFFGERKAPSEEEKRYARAEEVVGFFVNAEMQEPIATYYPGEDRVFVIGDQNSESGTMLRVAINYQNEERRYVWYVISSETPDGNKCLFGIWPDPGKGLQFGHDKNPQLRPRERFVLQELKYQENEVLVSDFFNNFDKSYLEDSPIEKIDVMSGGLVEKEKKGRSVKRERNTLGIGVGVPDPV